MRQELRRAGTVVPLEPQVFDVLAYLLAARPDRQQARAVRIRLAIGDPKQEFAGGLTEDIITGLSQQQWFFVIAR